MRGHGHRQPQRERLDRGEDGRRAAADLRAGRDRPAEGDRAGGRRQGRRRWLADGGGGRRRALHRRRRRALPPDAAAARGLRLRQRHGRGVRTGGVAAHGRRGDPGRMRPRLDLPQLQPQPRRPRDAERHDAGGARARRRSGAGLRRRRRPLRRRRRRGRGDLRRQDRPDPGPRPGPPVSERALRRRREVHRALHYRPGAEGRGRHDDLLEDRPQLHQAQDRRDRRPGRVREVRPPVLQPAPGPRL